MQMNESAEISSDEAANMTADELIDYAVKNGVMLITFSISGFTSFLKVIKFLFFYCIL